MPTFRRNLPSPSYYGYRFSETSVFIYQATWHNPDDSNFHTYDYENFKCRILILIYVLSFRFLSHIMWNVVLLSPCSKLLLKLLTGQVTAIAMNVILEEECVRMDVAASAFANRMSLSSNTRSRKLPFLVLLKPIDTYSAKL